MDQAAPLLDIPEAPVPPGAEAAWFTGAGGAKLRAALFAPPGRPRGSVVLSGGRTEPIEKYYETIADFMERGFTVLAHDWRGQGLSARDLPDRRKGHARGYKSFLEDYRRLLDTYEGRLPKPWIAVGHSMGGCLTLLALAQGEHRRFAGACLSAPMLGVKTAPVSPFAALVATRVNIFFGRAGRYARRADRQKDESSFELNELTHDRARFERYRAQLGANPDLDLGGPTWGWLDFALKATAYLARPERLHEVTIPVEIVSAGDDRLVDNRAQHAAARNLPQGHLVTAQDAFHEILMETDDMRNIFLRVFDSLTGKTAPKPAEAPKPAPVAAAAAPAAPAETATAPATAATAAAVASKPPAAKKAAAKKPAAAKAAKPEAAKPAAAKAPTAKKPPAKPAPAKKPAAAKATPAKAAPAKTPTAAKAPAAKKAPAKPAAAKTPATKKPPAAKKPAAPKK